MFFEPCYTSMMPNMMPDIADNSRHSKFRKDQKKQHRRKYIMRTFRNGNVNEVVTHIFYAKSISAARREATMWCIENKCNTSYIIRKAT